MPVPDLNKKIDRQTALLEEIVQQNKKTQKFILWGRILNLARLVIIITPIILAIIYIPPFVERAVNKSRELVPEIKELQSLKQGLIDFLEGENATSTTAMP